MMGLLRKFNALFVSVVVVAVVASAAPASAAAGDPDPLSLLRGGGAAEQFGLGGDVTTVWICNSGTAADIQTFTLTDVVAWANSTISPYFSTISRGRYSNTFVGGGIVSASNPNACLAAGRVATSTSNVMVIDRTSAAGGFGGSGLAYYSGNSMTTGSLADPASSTSRGFWLGGGSYGLPSIGAHEVGHTLAWPHSGSGATGSVAPYDNQYDIMSGAGTDSGNSGVYDNFCGSLGPCEVTHTMAINRYASGWVDLDQIEIVARKGIVSDLNGPEAAGKQMALIPSPDPLVYYTVEARPNTGYDAVLPFGGVVVHTVDLTAACSTPICWGAARRQHPAVSAIDNANHLIGVGSSLTLNGVTITVTAATASGYNVSFTGTPTGCAMGPNPFTDFDANSFAFASVGCIRVLGITTGTSATTYSPKASVTREQMAAFLARLWRALGNTCSSTPAPFSDLAGSFAAADVACIYDLKVTSGLGLGTYGTAALVTREQMAAFLGRLWTALGKTCSTAPTPFTDISDSFAVPDISCIYAIGITKGATATTYNPKGNVNREEMGAFLARFWDAALI